MSGFQKTNLASPSSVIAGDVTGTLGASTVAQTTNVKQLAGTPLTPWAGPSRPWLSEVGAATGSSTAASGALNQIAVNDALVAGNNSVSGLLLTQNVTTPATGNRFAIFGRCFVLSAGVVTQAQSLYAGVIGQATMQVDLGGTVGTPLGSAFGGNFVAQATTSGAFYQQVIGTEIDVNVPTGVNIQSKIGLLIVETTTDAVSGSLDDSAIMVANGLGVVGKWTKGLTFGRGATQWPFNSGSTLIATSNPGAANIGIDFTGITFSGRAIKTPGVIEADRLVTHPANSSAFAAAIGTGVQNTNDFDIMVSGCIDYTAAIAGATFTMGTGSAVNPTQQTLATIVLAGTGQAYFSAIVPAGYWLALGTTGTITPGTVNSVATPL